MSIKEFARTLAHEFGHAHADIFNVSGSYLFEAMDDKVNGGWYGHNKYDPGNKEVEDALRDLDKNYSNAKAELKKVGTDNKK